MDDQAIRRHIRIHGQVQGVFCRESLRERARAHGISGWVRNCPDGTVEAVLEGAPDEVDRMVRFSHTGPPRADVDHVDVTEERPEGLTGFAVR